jgi:membrane-associated PAP2 superfamily phosphatase
MPISKSAPAGRYMMLFFCVSQSQEPAGRYMKLVLAVIIYLIVGADVILRGARLLFFSS